MSRKENFRALHLRRKHARQGAQRQAFRLQARQRQNLKRFYDPANALSGRPLS